jgi:3-oxoacyl-[acyl-carrier protein] reductase
MDLGIDAKVALVTAASRGLGFASAAALAAEGCRIAITGRDPDALGRAAERLPEGTLTIVGDMADPSTPASVVEATVERFGGLDIAVGNAGGPPPARALEVEPFAMQSALQTNLLSSVALVQAAVPHLRAAGGGRVVLITSYGVRQPIPGLAYSNVARIGLLGWAKTAAQDLVADAITVNLVCPGPHRTDRAVELGLAGPMGEPEDLGRVVAFLCSAHAGFVSGAAIAVDGAGTLGLL